MAKKLIFFFICFVASAVLNADDTPHKSFNYLSQEPFIVNYKGVDVPLLGNGEEIKALLGDPDIEFDLTGDDSITGLDEHAIKYGDFFVVRYNPVTKNILDITSNIPDITLMGKKVIGMDIETFQKSTNYKFEDALSVGNYCYVDLGDFQILGLDREIVGNLQLSVIVKEGIIDWIYMCFSEYQYAP